MKMQVANSKPTRPRNAGLPRDDWRPGTAEGWRAASRSDCEGGSVAYAGRSSARTIKTPSGSVDFGLGVELIGAPCFVQGHHTFVSRKRARLEILANLLGTTTSLSGVGGLLIWIKTYLERPLGVA